MVTAHPDDVDFDAAAAVAAWTGAGIDVTYCVITDGQAGLRPRGRPRRHPRHPAPGAARRREAVGVQDVRFLGYVDGELEVTRRWCATWSRCCAGPPAAGAHLDPERSWERLAPSTPTTSPAGGRHPRRCSGVGQPVRVPRLLEGGDSGLVGVGGVADGASDRQPRGRRDRALRGEDGRAPVPREPAPRPGADPPGDARQAHRDRRRARPRRGPARASRRSSRSTGCRSGPRPRPHPARCAGCRPSTSPAAAHPCSPRSSGPACSPRVPQALEGVARGEHLREVGHQRHPLVDGERAAPAPSRTGSASVGRTPRVPAPVSTSTSR